MELDYSLLIQPEEQAWLDDMLSEIQEPKPAPQSKVAPGNFPRRCPVEECGQECFSRVGCLRRHWQLNHTPSIQMFQCIVAGCGFRNPREDKVRDHLGRQHKDTFPNPESRRRLAPLLPSTIVRNRQYKDPGSTPPPPELGKIMPPLAREIKKLSPTTSISGPQPTPLREINTPINPLPLANKRDADVPPYTPTPFKKPRMAETTNPLKESETTTLKRQYIENAAKIAILEEKNKKIKLELKKREETEARSLRALVESLKSELQIHKDLVRRRDREIRHMQQ